MDLINKITLGDCLKVMNGMPDESVDVVYIDPPYYKVKGEFDYEMTFEEWQEFHEILANESRRVLKDNGSLILWGAAKNIAYQQIIFDKYFSLLNSCVWEKAECQGRKMSDDSLRTFAPVTERFLFYDKGEDKSGLDMIMSNPDLFNSIKVYMRGERKKVMEDRGFKTIEEFNIYIRKVTNTSSVVDRHYFADSQYVFPTEEIYTKLQTTGFFQRKYKSQKEEYDGLRNEYDGLRDEYESLRRPFNVSSKIKFDVIKWSQESHITKKYKHETQKPLYLTIEIIKTISREGDTVLIPCSGSATEAEACYLTNRNFIAVEIKENYHSDSVKRLDELRSQGRLF